LKLITYPIKKSLKEGFDNSGIILMVSSQLGESSKKPTKIPII